MRKPLVAILLLSAATFVQGCAFKAYDSTGQRIKTCPVHNVKLRTFRVETIYGLPQRPSDEYVAAKEKDFPYAATPSLRGCIIGPFSWLNRHDRVRACPMCTEAREEYLERTGNDSGDV
jgi:hypothetical protein